MPEKTSEMAETRTLGSFVLVGELGRGGMGVVYRARRRDLPQSLAIKVLRRESGRKAERFAREQAILARLDHPSIVRFLDSGISEEGDAYYVMELVDGLPIDRYCAERRLDLRGRIALFLEVCAAVSHAHQHFVAHRDLKPANVLVDREGRPRLLDFGISKWLDGGETGQETTRGATPMTLLYASPEQVRGLPVSVATDVYSLAVLLFELLTGRLPHPPSSDVYGLALAIDRQPPPAASQALRERGEPARARELAGDLDAVLAKGLAKEPAARYGSVAELAADLRCYLAGQPVAARQPSRLTRAAYLVRRHRRASLAGAALLLLLATTAAVFAWQTRGLAREKSRAERAQALAEAREDLLVKVFAEGDTVGSGPHATLADALEAVSVDIERSLAAGEESGAALAATGAQAYRRLGDSGRAAALAAAALRSPAPAEPAELAVLLAVAALSEPAAPERWEARRRDLAELRRAASGRSGISECDLAAAWPAAMAKLGASAAQLSLAGELAFECALGRGAAAEARGVLALLERQRGSLDENHPARRELAGLGARLRRLEESRAAEVLP